MDTMNARLVCAMAVLLFASACKTPASGSLVSSDAEIGRFKIASDKKLEWIGTDVNNANKNCKLSIETNANGAIVSLLLTADFKGSSLSQPSSLTPITSGGEVIGYDGIADLFHGKSVSDFAYEAHVFRNGVTLASRPLSLGSAKRSAELYGDSLEQLRSIVYQERGFLSLDGECRDLSPL